MIIIMDMESGRYRGDDFGLYEEEVLNAQWLPQQSGFQPVLQLGLQQVVPVDAEEFLHRVYRNQG